MVYARAAQDADGDLGVEQTKVGGDLAGVEIGIVLGVEEARIAGRHIGLAAAPLDADAVEVDAPVTLEFRQKFERVRARQQHGVGEMRAGDGVAEHMRQEQALIDLMPVLVALVEGVLPLQRFRIGNEARRGGGGGVASSVSILRKRARRPVRRS